jgi:hypothetical protein
MPNELKIYQMGTTYTKWAQNIPNEHIKYQMGTKYNKVPLKITNGRKYYKIPFQGPPNLPKLGFLVQKNIWQPC